MLSLTLTFPLLDLGNNANGDLALIDERNSAGDDLEEDLASKVAEASSTNTRDLSLVADGSDTTPPSSLNYDGCPREYQPGSDYQEGSIVSMDGIVYKCRPYPLSLHCSQAGFELGSLAIDQTDHWKRAWEAIGDCSGTLSPTSSPIFVELKNLGGCPDEFQATGRPPYERGDLVTVEGLVFKCKVRSLLLGFSTTVSCTTYTRSSLLH